MHEGTIRPFYSSWPRINEGFISVVAGLTKEELAIRPSPDKWPLWATIGHVACQRVFWLCDFASEPDKDATPFPNAAYHCPGDEDLVNAPCGSCRRSRGTSPPLPFPPADRRRPRPR